MIDRLFLATLTFSVLIAGTLAIASALFGFDQQSVARTTAAAPVRIVQLERVVVTAKRIAPATKIAQRETSAAVQ